MSIKFREKGKAVFVELGVTPSSYASKYLSLKGYERVTFLLYVDNATTVTGSAVTVKQATAVAGTGEKAVAFTKAYSLEGVSATDQQTSEFDVTSNTFTTDATDNQNNLYEIEIDKSQLDVENDFDCVSLDLGDGANTAITVIAILHDSKFGRVPANPLID